MDLEDRWGDYTFYRMNKVIDVYFVGGFGTLNWVGWCRLTLSNQR